MENELFWADKIAEELLKRKVSKHVVATGTSMSGEPHVGNANDVIRGDAIRKALIQKGAKAELVWISDDMDPFRSVPAGLPKELETYLGIPAALIPDLYGCHKNFIHHFETLFIEQLESLDIEPKILLGIEMYKDGMYNETIKIAMDKRKEIASILNKFRTNPLPDDWYPLDIICEKCNKISTTKIISYDAGKSQVEYVCREEETVLHKKHVIRGCGYRGKASVYNGRGKMTWRVEWPARWSFLKVTCEPFGKEHAASGGSWDTGKEIVKVFGWEPPFPVIYEHFQVKGEKMSKSKGNVVTVPMMLEILTKEQLKFWMYFGKISKVRDINLSTLPITTIAEFDRAERIFFGEKTENPREDYNYKRAFELSFSELPKEISIQIPFDYASMVAQIVPEEKMLEKAIELLRSSGHIKNELSKQDKERLLTRLQLAKNWAEKYADEQYKIKLADKPSAEIIRRLSDKQKQALSVLASDLLKKKFSEQELYNRFFEIAKECGIQTKELFAAVYLILLSKPFGPRLAPFILTLGQKEVAEKLKL